MINNHRVNPFLNATQCVEGKKSKPTEQNLCQFEMQHGKWLLVIIIFNGCLGMQSGDGNVGIFLQP